MEQYPPGTSLPVSDDWLIGGGEMGNLVRAKDWSTTPLGPREDWPHGLRTAVNFCLNSNFPIALAWGPGAVQIYNDGYWPIAGSKHPEAMGEDFRKCWASAWPDVGESFESAAAGQTAFLDKKQMYLDRYGYLEETFFTVSFSPIYDEDGQVAGIFHPVTDMTEQVLVERRLRILQTLPDSTAEARSVDDAAVRMVKALGEAAPDLPFVQFYTLNDSHTEARLVASTGLNEADESVKSPWIDLGDSETVWPMAEVVRSDRNRELKDLSEQTRIIGPAFPEPVEEAVVMPVTTNSAEAPVGVLVLGVSPRRRLNTAYRTFLAMLWNGFSKELSDAEAYERERERTEALAAMDRAKTDFFANISHELRTPLTLLLGPLRETLLADQGRLDPADRQRLEMAHRNGLRLMKLVNSLLEFSRIEAGGAQAAFAPVDLARLTLDLTSMFRSAFETAGLELRVDCPEGPEPVYVDSTMWKKVVLNLLSNAFKFTFEGHVAVQLRWHARNVELVVEDTGTGIPDRELPRLFERFYRVPNAEGRTFEGTGIGLALVRELVQLHGGDISVTSVEGSGTRFSISIPLGTAHLPVDETVDSSPTLPPEAAEPYVQEAMQWLDASGSISPSGENPGEHQRGQILVADDNADMRQYLSNLLSEHWSVETVKDGVTALEALRRSTPDLVICDVMMPRMSGFQLLENLRAEPDLSRIPVILLSARAGEEARVEGINAGADDYLVKPFFARELIARVDAHMNAARVRQHDIERAQHDPLTDLPNRVLTYEFTERLIASADRAGSHMAVLFIDMDKFKPINDRYGHAVGDAVLIEIARRLKAGVRDEDSVGRLGGDEFVAALSHINGPDDVAYIARNLCKLLVEPYHVEGLELHTTPSIGIALYPEDGRTPEALTEAADSAMYDAKTGEDGHIQFYRRDLYRYDQRLSELEYRLRKALDNREFSLYYQPMVDLDSGQITGVEALLRWPGTDFGPEQFIPVAERCGLMHELGKWVIDEACRQMKAWQNDGLPTMTLSLNLSPQQFHHADLIQHLVRSVGENGLLPGALQIEISAADLAKGEGETLKLLGNMKTLGFKLGLDRFSGANSNLGDLIQMAPDTIKMDRQLSQPSSDGTDANSLVNGIISLGASLGFQVVAGGIENQGMLQSLQRAKCQSFQGFYICPPVAANDFANWYQKWKTA